MFQNIANLHTRIPHLNATLASTYSKYRKFFPKIVRPLVEQYIYKISIDAFDSCFSLGSNCLAATILREINLRKCSGPFDWIAGLPYLRKLFKYPLRTAERNKNVRSAFSNIDNGACFSLKIAEYYYYNMNS